MNPILSNIIGYVVLILLTALIGGLVFYNLIPLAFTDASLRRDMGRLKAYLALRWHIMTRYTWELGGYVHDTAVSAWISPNMCSYVTGTWTDAVGAVTGTVVKEKAAADNTGVVYIPISAAMWSNSVALKGSYIKSIDLYYAVTTAALDAAGATALIDKFVLPANGAAFPTLAAQAFTYDTGNDTAAESDDLDEHTMTLTLTTPIWLDNDDLLQVRLTMDAATTSVIRFHGARVNATVRL
jgi:hypothetical protein